MVMRRGRREMGRGRRGGGRCRCGRMCWMRVVCFFSRFGLNLHYSMSWLTGLRNRAYIDVDEKWTPNVLDTASDIMHSAFCVLLTVPFICPLFLSQTDGVISLLVRFSLPLRKLHLPPLANLPLLNSSHPPRHRSQTNKVSAPHSPNLSHPPSHSLQWSYLTPFKLYTQPLIPPNHPQKTNLSNLHPRPHSTRHDRVWRTMGDAFEDEGA